MGATTHIHPEPLLTWLRRLWRHHWQHEQAAHRAVPDDMAQRLTQRVGASERRHTGQVVLCIEGALPPSYVWRAGRQAPVETVVRQRAMAWFGRLRAWDTEHNNGVLIYLLLAERRIEIVADRGLQRCASARDWQDVVSRLSAHLQRGDTETGLTQALEEVSALLVAHFPQVDGAAASNELPDTVVRV
ncbi:MAG: TPM domain-containing protein [Limnohabitans sp.]